MKSDGDPSALQAQEEIKNYYINAEVGSAACIRMTYASTLEFKMSVIE
jgi:hypothetical protein